MIIESLPNSLSEDSYDMFGETILQMMIDDFNVDRNSIECVIKLSKQADAIDKVLTNRFRLFSFKNAYMITPLCVPDSVIRASMEQGSMSFCGAMLCTGNFAERHCMESIWMAKELLEQRSSLAIFS